MFSEFLPISAGFLHIVLPSLSLHNSNNFITKIMKKFIAYAMVELKLARITLKQPEMLRKYMYH